MHRKTLAEIKVQNEYKVLDLVVDHIFLRIKDTFCERRLVNCKLLNFFC